MPTNAKKILVVGGAGFIGSHMLILLRRAGYIPIVLDNLSTGHRDAVKDDVPFYEANMADAVTLDAIFTEHTISAVMHFAGYIEVGESVKDPLKYYDNNVSASLTLFRMMLKHQVKHLVFSSTAAVYGLPKSNLISEQHQIKPINPYGKSKYVVEEIIRDLHTSHGMRYAILRYFNAAGADPDGQLGERHAHESHLIPLLLQVAAGIRKNITVYGNKHLTPDGTCVRDYVHIVDICQAHLLALQQLWKEKTEMTYNIGIGRGYSVLQVIKAVERVTKVKIEKIFSIARPGDPAILIADALQVRENLNWQPRYADLDVMIEHAWQYLQKTRGSSLITSQ